ncbi:MAG: hypothetical protein ACYDDF_04130 [Thermoplasmatota archaeon]
MSRLVSLLAAVLFASTLISGAEATPGAWSLMATPDTGSTQYNQFQAVTCPAATDCWAVGYEESAAGSATEIAHWDGASWALVESPNSDPTQSNFLLGVTCASASDCWAVGHHDDGATNTFSTLTLHYDGQSWAVVPSANVAQAQDNELIGVSCVGSADCWAVGYDSVGNPAFATGNVLLYQTLVEHWDGSMWTIASSPNAPAVALPGPTGPVAGTPGNNELQAVSCASATMCVAVGGHVNGVNAEYTLIEVYDGQTWTVVPSPNPSSANYQYLLGVTCLSETRCWAVGYESGATATQSLMLLGNGSSWSVVPSANAPTGSNFPFSVSCASAQDCWAVGYSYDSGNVITLTDHYDGSAWSVVSSPNGPSENGQDVDFLRGVACDPASTTCVAAGYSFDSAGYTQTLAENVTGAP